MAGEGFDRKGSFARSHSNARDIVAQATAGTRHERHEAFGESDFSLSQLVDPIELGLYLFHEVLVGFPRVTGVHAWVRFVDFPIDRVLQLEGLLLLEPYLFHNELDLCREVVK